MLHAARRAATYGVVSDGPVGPFSLLTERPARFGWRPRAVAPCPECARLVRGECRSTTCRALRERRTRPLSILDCPECAAVFVAKGVQAYCSAVCSTKAANRRKRHRERESGRRAGWKPVVERYTMREIAERDRWRCHLCGKRVPDRAYAARDRDPTLDHLVPLSDGGWDIRSNVALAHNRCNWERATGGEVQLRLVG